MEEGEFELNIASKNAIELIKDTCEESEFLSKTTQPKEVVWAFKLMTTILGESKLITEDLDETWGNIRQYFIDEGDSSPSIYPFTS